MGGRRRVAVAGMVATMAVLAAAVGACGSSDTSPSGATTSKQPKTVTVEAVSQAETLSVHVGDTVAVSLPGNPSTGYQWDVSLDEDGVVERAGEPTFDAESDVMGAPGVVTIPLKAVKAGGAIAVFKEMPPGDTDEPPANTSAVYIDVREGSAAARIGVDQDYISETHTITQGDTLRVHLDGASASTGYEWRIADISGDALKQAGEPQTDVEGDQPGAAERTTFELAGAAVGQSTVVFDLLQPGTQGVARTWAVTVEVLPVLEPRTVSVDAHTAKEGIVTELVQGGTLLVKLGGNPSTGYGWELTPTLQGVLEQRGDPTFTPDNDVMGSPGKVTYAFDVTGSGSVELRAAYKDLGGESSEPVRAYTFKLKCHAEEKPTVVEVVGRQSAPLVPLHVGDRLQVHLKGQAQGPYDWTVAAIDDAVLKQVGTPSFEETGPGGAGTVTVTLEAVGAGSTTPVLLHAAEGRTTESTFAFTATVVKEPRHKTFHAVARAPEKTVELKSGDTLAVELPGNATTGYGWVDATPDTAILVESGEPSYAPESDAMGAPGVFTLKWGASGPGGELVMAEYVKPGDQDGVPEALWSTWVVVKDK